MENGVTPNVQLIDTRRPRSRFVDLFAWLLIAMAACGAAICLPRGVLVSALFPVGGGAPLDPAPGAAPAPLLRAVLEHLPLLLDLLFVACAAAAVFGVGLLWRRNWARAAVVGLLGAGILFVAAALAGQFFLSWPVSPAAGATPDFEARLRWLVAVLRALASLGALGVAGVFGWLIVRLRSRAIRSEFV
jgi:hypothetical protein